MKKGIITEAFLDDIARDLESQEWSQKKELDGQRFWMPWPKRFRNEADAMEFMRLINERKPVPQNLHIHPFVVKDGVCSVSKEYLDAPFELGYVVNPKVPFELVDA